MIVLGATGSIGQRAANQNAAGLAAQANRFRPEVLCMVDASKGDELRARLDADYRPRLLFGEEGLVELAGSATEADLVLVAIVGTGGLRPALAAIEAGRDLAVASKEILVMAGETVMRAAAARGVKVLPVDSEHNAIFQCL